MNHQSKSKTQLLKQLNHELRTTNISSNQATINQIIKSSQSQNQKVLKMPLIIALFKLYQNKSYNFIYHNYDKYKDARDINSSQDFPTLRTITSLNLAKIQSYQKEHHKTIIETKLTPLGKEFVKSLLLLPYQKTSKKIRHAKFKLIYEMFLAHDNWIGSCCGLLINFLASTLATTFLITFLQQFIPNSILNSNVFNVISLIILISMIIFLSVIESIRSVKYEIKYRIKYNNYDSLANAITQDKVTQFLKQHNVKVPNLKFTLNSQIPSLYQAIFTTSFK